MKILTMHNPVHVTRARPTPPRIQIIWQQQAWKRSRWWSTPALKQPKHNLRHHWLIFHSTPSFTRAKQADITKHRTLDWRNLERLCIACNPYNPTASIRLPHPPYHPNLAHYPHFAFRPSGTHFVPSTPPTTSYTSKKKACHPHSTTPEPLISVAEIH